MSLTGASAQDEMEVTNDDSAPQAKKCNLYGPESQPPHHKSRADLGIDLNRLTITEHKEDGTDWAISIQDLYQMIKTQLMNEGCLMQAGAVGAPSGETTSLMAPQTSSARPNKRTADKPTDPRLTGTKSKISKTNQQFSLRNKFNVLGEALLDSPTTQPINSLNNIKNRPNAATSAPKVHKIKPITIKTNDNQVTFIEDLAMKPGCKFQAKNGGDFIRVFPTDRDAHSAITKQLEKDKVQHYTIPEAIDRPLKVVLRGLPINVDTEVIKNKLNVIGFDIQTVSPMLNRTKRVMPLYRIEITKTDNAIKILDITNLFHFDVKIEPYRAPKRTLQCFRCQYYHHGSSRCFMDPRCVKCGGPHTTQDCEINDKIENPRCSNCGGDHVASYRGCPKFPENLKPKPKTSPPRNPSTTGLSYSAATAPKTNIHIPPSDPRPQSSSSQSLPALTGEFQCDILSLLSLRREIETVKTAFGVQSISDIATLFKEIFTTRPTTINVNAIDQLYNSPALQPNHAPPQ